MGDIKLGEPFGLDVTSVSDDDWQLSLQRIVHDLRSDFIYAPHIGFIYRKAGKELIDLLKSELKAGKYLPELPVTIEVPKSFRIKVSVSPPRLGPTYSRPGSILSPKDRLFYQVLADKAAPIIDAKTDHTRSFSHQLDEDNGPIMFKPTRVCWSSLQDALASHIKLKTIKYVLKIDVANFFGAINQHTLINTLSDAGYPSKFSSRLEAVLTAFAGDRSSRGILQGIYPSDLLGNFYMEPIDRFLSDLDIPSARYVDDMYIFLTSVDESERVMRELIPELRRYDLVLNEAKSIIMPKMALNTEEPDLETLFDEAVEEISQQLDEEDFDADYGFQSEWEEEGEQDEGENLELEATKILFDAISDYPGHEENIERFCLPLFSKANSDYAVSYVLDVFKKRPSMAQIYVSYLSKFISEEKVYKFLVDILGDSSIVDWQLMWVLASLLMREPKDDQPVKMALQLLKSGNSHDALRAVAAVYVGRYGDAARRKTLVGFYQNVSPYVQAAIYFSSRYWPGVERKNAKAMWGNLGTLNQLLSKALANE